MSNATLVPVPVTSSALQNGKAKKQKKITPPLQTTNSLPARFTVWAIVSDPRFFPAFGILFTGFLSSILNGYANSLQSPTPWSGWMMGLAIPIIVLTLGKVTSVKCKRRQYYPAAFAAASGIGLLLLSVYHCSVSLAALTGSSFWLSVPMAVAIDCGLVACEWALIVED